MFRQIVGIVVWSAFTLGWGQNFEERPGNPNVYLVYASGCGEYGSGEAVLTGFILQNIPGIVTALHGVVNCGNIQAFNASIPEQDTQRLDNMELAGVNFAFDLALLKPSTSESDVLPSGLPFVGLKTTDDELIILGHARGALGQLDREVEGTKRTDILSDILPRDALNLLMQRGGSPDVDRRVLRLQNAMLPGYSGAPVLDTQERVVAVGQGGSSEGQEGWAALLEDACAFGDDQQGNISEEDCFSDPALQQDKIDKLAGNPSLLSALFAINVDLIPEDTSFTISDVNDDHGASFEVTEKSFVKRFEAKPGYKFTGVVTIDEITNTAADGPFVSIIDGGDVLEVFYRIRASPSAVTTGIPFEGELTASITAQQIPVTQP